MATPIDTLIAPRWIIPVEPDCRPLSGHAVAVDQGQIVAIAPLEQARQAFAPREAVDLDRHVMLPGLVNAHTHASMSLFRGLADDLPLQTWLHDHIWPAEAAWISESFIEAGTEHAIAEMIRSGTSCFNDMYFFPDTVARVVQNAGMRACVGLIVIDFPTAWAQDADDYLAKGTELHDQIKGSPLISTAFAPHAPYTVADAALEKIRVLADELDIPVHMHVHETAHEIDESIKLHHVRPLERLNALGLLSDRLLAVHMTQLLDAEIEAVARNGASVVHCPESNLKLASGLAPVGKMLGHEVNVALGTDGAASNNDLDMLGEMRSAALLGKGVSGDPTALPCDAVLRMATINGARALGLEGVCGSIEAGKAADLLAVDLHHVATQPVYDPLPQLIYSAGRDQVTDLWVAGKRLLRDRVLTTLDEARLLRASGEWGARIAGTEQPQDSTT